MTTRHRRRNMDLALERRIENMALNGYSGKDIFDMMASWEEWNPEKPVLLRTVQNMVKRVNERDRSGLWTVADRGQSGEFLYTPEEARVVLDTLAAVILRYARKRTFTKDEARWVLRIGKLANNLPADCIWHLACSYLLAENRGESTEALDAFLSFEPWRSKHRYENYQTALDRGLVKADTEGWSMMILHDREPEEVEDTGNQDRHVMPADLDPKFLKSRLRNNDRFKGALPPLEQTLQDEAKRLALIRARKPELYKKIIRAKEKADARFEKLVKENTATGFFEKATTEEVAEQWHTILDFRTEYQRLVDSFEDGESPTHRGQKGQKR